MSKRLPLMSSAAGLNTAPAFSSSDGVKALALWSMRPAVQTAMTQQHASDAALVSPRRPMCVVAESRGNSPFKALSGVVRVVVLQTCRGILEKSPL